MATNQADSPSVGPNDVNTSKTSGGKNTIAVARGTSGKRNAIAIESDISNERAGELKGGVNSTVRNEGAEELNGDVKVGLKV